MLSPTLAHRKRKNTCQQANKGSLSLAPLQLLVYPLLSLSQSLLLSLFLLLLKVPRTTILHRIRLDATVFDKYSNSSCNFSTRQGYWRTIQEVKCNWHYAGQEVLICTNGGKNPIVLVILLPNLWMYCLASFIPELYQKTYFLMSFHANGTLEGGYWAEAIVV